MKCRNYSCGNIYSDQFPENNLNEKQRFVVCDFKLALQYTPNRSTVTWTVYYHFSWEASQWVYGCNNMSFNMFCSVRPMMAAMIFFTANIVNTTTTILNLLGTQKRYTTKSDSWETVCIIVALNFYKIKNIEEKCATTPKQMACICITCT